MKGKSIKKMVRGDIDSVGLSTAKNSIKKYSKNSWPILIIILENEFVSVILRRDLNNR